MEQKLIKVVVGSKNPVKVNASRTVIAALYPNAVVECAGLNAPSNVPEQPMNAAETREGAINRVQYCQQHAEADFYIAIEGGVDLLDDGPATFAYVVIANHEQESVGRSAALPLPAAIYQSLLAGEELGPVMDRLFKTVNIKHKGGAIGLLTNGHATRESNYTQALTLAMAPFLYCDLYSQ
ncbi:MAG: inosine/xanthosine triphosphatase [Moritella sp.]|uniref:inosine/xanthosine triphosphatase n=1 Tax=Moritella sp. TaxID=78556 RepID=UPI0029A1A847|nr:inosine/xanthosine triphosphatase [Moritella sp.]MDX2322365.1 inosine/xanthosine triphosphatase [Moritella sp.]